MRESSWSKIVIALLLQVAVVASFALVAGRALADSLEAKAKAFEARLLAPCCFQQTMDIHRSDKVDELRREIRTRLGRGESIEQLERDFEARFGARVIAVPRESPLEAVGLATFFAVVLSGIWLRFRARGWVGRDPCVAGPASTPATEDPYDAALEAELRKLEA